MPYLYRHCIQILGLVAFTLGGLAQSARFVDPVLERHIWEQLGSPDGEVSIADLESIQDLEIRDVGVIRRLDGVEQLVNLQRLDMSYSWAGSSSSRKTALAIHNFSALKTLRHLTHLAINGNHPKASGGNEFPDYTFLSEMPQLKFLELAYSEASDFALPESLPHLETLILGCNGDDRVQIPDSYRALKVLKLGFRFSGDRGPGGYCSLNVDDYSFLRAFTNLEQIHLFDVGMTDFELPESLEKVSEIHLYGAHLRRLSLSDTFGSIPIDLTIYDAGTVLDLRNWEGVSRIRSIKLFRASELKTLNLAEGMTRLEVLEIERAYKLVDLGLPRDLSAMERLYINAPGALRSLVIPTGMHKLKELIVDPNDGDIDESEMETVDLPDDLGRLERLYLAFGSRASELTLPEGLDRLKILRIDVVDGGGGRLKSVAVPASMDLLTLEVLGDDKARFERYGPLRVLRNGTEIELIWPTGVIQVSEQATGPWIGVSEAHSPYPVTMTRRQRFFRVVPFGEPD